MQGRQLGTEQATVIATADGWTIRATGRLAAPVDLSTTRFEMRLTTASGGPIALEVDRQRCVASPCSCAPCSQVAARPTTSPRPVSSRGRSMPCRRIRWCCPPCSSGAYEALALRLRAASVPVEFRAYVARRPRSPCASTGSGSERIRTADRMVSATRYDLTIANRAAWSKPNCGSMRRAGCCVSECRRQGLEVAREDVAAVSSRVETMGRPTMNRS